MTKRKRITLIILATLTLIGAVSVIWAYMNRWTVERTEIMIRKEAPIGSDIGAVDAMLTAHQIPHWEYPNELDIGNFDDKPEKLRGIAKGYIGAIKRDVGWDVMIRWDIAMRFYFDEHDKLIDYTVKMMGTGP
jgi:hypothetical protein